MLTLLEVGYASIDMRDYDYTFLWMCYSCLSNFQVGKKIEVERDLHEVGCKKSEEKSTKIG